MALDPCVLTNVLANDYAVALTTINRKFNALRRLAELLEQLGDISPAIPNIGALIPLQLINLSAYEDLVAACPFLNLPKHPTNTDIAKLQALVLAAYQRLLGNLNQHPWLRMNALQAQLDKVHARLNEILSQGAQFVQCLQQACASADAATTFVADVVTSDLNGQVDNYTRNFVANNGQVLTSGMQAKAGTVNGAIDQVNELMTPAPITSSSLGPKISPVPNPGPQLPLPPAD